MWQNAYNEANSSGFSWKCNGVLSAWDTSKVCWKRDYIVSQNQIYSYVPDQKDYKTSPIGKEGFSNLILKKLVPHVQVNFILNEN